MTSPGTSTAAPPADATSSHGTSPAHAHAGASVKTYLLIGVVLAVLTVVEWQLPQHMAHGALLVVTLLGTAFFKAALVAGFYMHLRYDSRVYVGIAVLSLVLIAYFLVLLTYGHLRV